MRVEESSSTNNAHTYTSTNKFVCVVSLEHVHVHVHVNAGESWRVLTSGLTVLPSCTERFMRSSMSFRSSLS